MQVLIQNRRKTTTPSFILVIVERRRKMNTLPINTGDTAFMILCTAMVCLMTPGLAFTAD